MPPMPRRPRPHAAWHLDALRLERERIRRLMTYGDLAQATRIHRNTLADIMQGRRQPTMGTARIILKALELDPGEVVHFDEPAA